MKDYKYYIEKMKNELNFDELVNKKDINIITSIVVNWCRKELKKYYSDSKLEQLEIARDTFLNEIMLKRFDKVV